MNPQAVLSVNRLKVYYWKKKTPIKAVDDVSFDLFPGERLGIVGESGSGKSTLAFALMRLHKLPAKIEGGEIRLSGFNLVDADTERMRQLRWSAISLIPQGAMNSLNPVMRIRHQMADAITAHEVGWSDARIRARIADLLERVGLPANVADMYPHELSGGMKQRVCIALAIVLEPKVIIADEPTSALDVVVQRVVMQTLNDVQQQLGSAMIVIGHDMGLMAQSVDRLAVMYAGKIVENAPIRTFFRSPSHPYSQMLISSLPSPDEKRVLTGIPGMQPSLLDLPPGCAFQPRCPVAIERCRTQIPASRVIDRQHEAACHLVEEKRLEP